MIYSPSWSALFRRFAIPLILAVFLAHCQGEAPSTHAASRDTYPNLPNEKVRNVIFFIGDGMGLSQITAARLKALGAEGRLTVEKMPVTGILHTHSIDNLLTDSAAGATALATGHKTRNGMIAMLPDRTSLPTILEALQQRGYASGLVATSSITHATPACFAAHVPRRSMEAEIAAQILDTGVDVILGGGKRFFLPQSVSGSGRADDIDLLQRARKQGYSVIETREALAAADHRRLLGLFQMGALNNEPPEPTLAELTAKAIDVLRRDSTGFFLMVEGSQIDWGSHDNEVDYTVREMLSFDKAIEVGLDFALQDRHTLVLVTADHETGGMSINGGHFDGSNLKIGWTTTGHTGVPVPLFAFGPFSRRFTGMNDNTQIPYLLAEVLKLPSFPLAIME